MKILVLLSQVPDTTARIAFTNDNTQFDASGVTFIVNPYDEWYALVRALELKEAAGAGSVTTITVGGADTEATIRKGLAIGADEAVRVDAQPTEALQVAEQVAAYAKDKGLRPDPGRQGDHRPQRRPSGCHGGRVAGPALHRLWPANWM